MKHKTQTVSRSHLYKEKLNTALKMHAVKFPESDAVIKKQHILKLQSVTSLTL